MSEIESVAVVGAGTMGNGIVHVFAMHGYPVVMVDVHEEVLETARATIATNMDRQIAKGTLTEATKAESLARITAATELEAVATAELVIEAASENRDVKFQLFREVDSVAAVSAILATNTSSISITEIAART